MKIALQNPEQKPDYISLIGTALSAMFFVVKEIAARSSQGYMTLSAGEAWILAFALVVIAIQGARVVRAWFQKYPFHAQALEYLSALERLAEQAEKTTAESRVQKSTA